jgi:hypothetical protein
LASETGRVAALHRPYLPEISNTISPFG